MHHGHNGQQQGVDCQTAHAVVGPDGGDEFFGLALGLAAGHRFRDFALYPSDGQLYGQAPVTGKGLHVFVAEIADPQLSTASQSHPAVSHWPGGDDETVVAVGGHKVVYLLGYPAALTLSGHLVHPIQQHNTLTIFQSFLKEPFRALFGSFRCGA